MHKRHKCCIPGCGLKNNTIKLFSFPKSRMSNFWLVIITKKFPTLKITRDRNNRVTQMICQRHFEDKYLLPDSRRTLHAIPTLFTNKEIEMGVPSQPISMVTAFDEPLTFQDSKAHPDYLIRHDHRYGQHNSIKLIQENENEIITSTHYEEEEAFTYEPDEIPECLNGIPESYKPFKVTFKPSKVTFKPSKVTFKPSKVTFKPLKYTGESLSETQVASENSRVASSFEVEEDTFAVDEGLEDDWFGDSGDITEWNTEFIEPQWCRICLAADHSLYPIADTPLQDVYERITLLKLQTDDRPALACYLCYHQLQKVQAFIEQCVQADEMLSRMLAGDQTLSEDMSKIRSSWLTPALGVGPREAVSCAPEAAKTVTLFRRVGGTPAQKTDAEDSEYNKENRLSDVKDNGFDIKSEMISSPSTKPGKRLNTEFSEEDSHISKKHKHSDIHSSNVKIKGPTARYIENVSLELEEEEKHSRTIILAERVGEAPIETRQVEFSVKNNIKNSDDMLTETKGETYQVTEALIDEFSGEEDFSLEKKSKGDHAMACRWDMPTYKVDDRPSTKLRTD